MSFDLMKRAMEIIDSNEYINIATENNSQPWNTPVYALHDNDLCFYWSSWINAQHSKNIRANPKIFITIYDSTRKRGDNHQKGVYIRATARELTLDQDIRKSFEYFTSVDGKTLLAEDFMENNPKRMYKAVTEKIWLNDLSESKLTNQTIKMRVEVKE